MAISKFKTFVYKNRTKTDQNWYLIDAEGEVLGRLAVRVANILRGKSKPEYTPHIDSGDAVIIINAEKIVFKGNNKLTDKKYYSHSSFANGFKEESLESLFKRSPQKVILKAVRGMMPKNKLRDPISRKLKIYRGSEHPHQAQKVIAL